MTKLICDFANCFINFTWFLYWSNWHGTIIFSAPSLINISNWRSYVIVTVECIVVIWVFIDFVDSSFTKTFVVLRFKTRYNCWDSCSTRFRHCQLWCHFGTIFDIIALDLSITLVIVVLQNRTLRLSLRFLIFLLLIFIFIYLKMLTIIENLAVKIVVCTTTFLDLLSTTFSSFRYTCSPCSRTTLKT